MKNVLIIDSTYPVNSRTRKIADSLAGAARVTVCAWNRGAPQPCAADERVLEQAIGYGNKWRKLVHLRRFYRHVAQVMAEARPQVVIASHWECMFIAALLKPRFAFRLVYDCLDVPTAAHPLLLKLLWAGERFFVRRVDLILFASRFFARLYPPAVEGLVLENLPPAGLADVPLALAGSGRPVVSWVGVVRYYDTLRNLVDACAAHRGVDLHVFGDGPDLARLQAYCEGRPVVFHGRYRPENLKSIYAFSDLVWAAYPAADFNVRYAISNKYHECLRYGVVGLFSRQTLLGQMVEQDGQGVAVDETDAGDIRRAIERGLALAPPVPVPGQDWETAFARLQPRILGESPR